MPTAKELDLAVDTPIPVVFDHLHQYLRSFALPMLEEMREDLRASLEPTQLRLEPEQVKLMRLEDALKAEMLGLPPAPPWFGAVAWPWCCGSSDLPRCPGRR